MQPAKEISNADFENKNLVIYFYPKDSTPGCTTEGQDFRDNLKNLKNLIRKYWEYQEIRSNLMKILKQTVFSI